MNLQVLITVFTAMGGFEFVKWFFTRKVNKRMNESQADIAETQAEADEFHLLRERLELSDKQLLEKEQRFHEQTLLVRDLNRQLLEMTNKYGEAQARISALEAERELKFCERRGCKRREPQSGY